MGKGEGLLSVFLNYLSGWYAIYMYNNSMYMHYMVIAVMVTLKMCNVNIHVTAIHMHPSVSRLSHSTVVLCI